MNAVVQDIETLENAIILLKEGASDEKQMAFNSLVKMLTSKKEELAVFESQFELEYINA
jgi:hypothetical protein|tara:strand:+ start:153 stop:329 length:177 start_codon:yes stop_codon:yes gene_type:complete